MWWDSLPKHICFFLLCFGWVHSMLLCISRQWWIVPQFCPQYRRVLDLIVLHLLYKRNELWATLQHLQWKWLSALLLARDITLSSRLPPLLGSLEKAREFTVSCQWKLGVKHKTKSCQQLYIQFRCCRNFLLHFFPSFSPGWVISQDCWSMQPKQCSRICSQPSQPMALLVLWVNCVPEKNWLLDSVSFVQGSHACTAQLVVMPGRESLHPSAPSHIPQLFSHCSSLHCTDNPRNRFKLRRMYKRNVMSSASETLHNNSCAEEWRVLLFTFSVEHCSIIKDSRMNFRDCNVACQKDIWRWCFPVLQKNSCSGEFVLGFV